MSHKAPLDHLLGYPLLGALFGRRARRFGLGMEIPSGPLAYKSRHAPMPLSELERAILIAAATGVTGWNFGVPFGPDRPDEHAHYSVRFTGRTAPTAGGFGTPALLFTDDDGLYITNTRDVPPERMREFDGIRGRRRAHHRRRPRAHGEARGQAARPAGRAAAHARAQPVDGECAGLGALHADRDASEQVLALMAMAIANGNVLMDDEAGSAGGRARAVHPQRPPGRRQAHAAFGAEQSAYEANCSELAFMGHNIVLTMQAMGLGGLYFNGLNRWSILGAFADNGIKGFGFRFLRDERWTLPNPVGLDGVYEAMCPPYYTDMAAAVKAFVTRKFGQGGAYDPAVPGAWKRSAEIKQERHALRRHFIACMSEVAGYIHRQARQIPRHLHHHRAAPGFVQAVHLDTEFYDAHYKEGAYLDTHAEHMERWHAAGTAPTAVRESR
jgi:hypothetical protein